MSSGAKRLLIHVEGEAEETFVGEVIRPHLLNFGYDHVSARLLGNARQRDRRGGIKAWIAVKKDILNHLRQDRDCIATTMVDYYALPATGQKAWPGRAEAIAKAFSNKAETVQSALHAEICHEMGSGFNPVRFIPFVIMHEFEALLFSDCKSFAKGVGRTDLLASLQEIRDSFDTPEQINDSDLTAPSKRILDLMPGYQKPLHGNLAALEMGLTPMRDECTFFGKWIELLEKT
jgi:hypothetical protein